ncbi:MAG TPA: caspase family protein [Bradyrhizobium sp.]|nr:caspase family protein [Bradyrhizobium sp.]HLZ02508.1 caspase family protein [Bradyrhizobium sp.]
MRVRGLLGSLKFWLAALLILISQPALAEKRVALVLGNAAYQNVPPLANPVNDAALMADTLRRAGFDVVDSRKNLSALQTRRALREFADKAADADIAVIYYAGHGIEVDGSNYLIPVDAKLERDTDVYDEAFSLDRVLVAAESAKKLRLVILDACRDNPFAQTMKRTLATRSIGRGLAKLEPSSPNTLIAYSAKAGSTAEDGAGRNSPFTIALSNHLTTPGLDVRRAFGFVRDDVLKATSNHQEPFVYGSLGGDDVPLVPAPATAASPAIQQPAPNSQADIRRDYELALQVGNRAAFDAFLKQHPDGFYASLARLQRDKYVADEAHAAAVEKAKQAEEERQRLAAAGAEKEAQDKAEADAEAAEQARLDAERVREATQQQAAEAERKRMETATIAPAAPATADKKVTVASLNPAPDQTEITKSVQSELRRVGCYAGNVDGDWDNASQRSLSLFNRNAGLKLDVKMVSADTLDAIKQKTSRVCPLVCQHGFKANGDHCSRIVCAEGFFINDDNECVKQRGKATATRNENDRSSRHARQDRLDSRSDAGYGATPRRSETRPSRAQAQGSGQIYCDNVGCRPVRPGCHLGYHGGGGPGNIANPEICN